MEGLENRQMLTVFTVNTTVDEDDGIADGQISLRDAIFEAVSGDTIDFNTSLNGGTITLDRTGLGEIDIAESLTIDASMLPAGITIDANDPTPGVLNGDGIRIFSITGRKRCQEPFS
jgi:hypothetical protein